MTVKKFTQVYLANMFMVTGMFLGGIGHFDTAAWLVAFAVWCRID